MKRDIEERTFNFGVNIVELSYELPESKAGKVLGGQILRSGTSIGANVEEARSAYTRSGFAYKMNIALSEARESHYWLRLMRASSLVSASRLDHLIDEADQLRKILGSIVSKSRGERGA